MDDRYKIITEYGKFIERHHQTAGIQDVAVLPYPKETILSALLLEIVRGNVLQLEAIRICARLLAQFQLGVGPEPLERLGVDVAKLQIPPKNAIEGQKSLVSFIIEAENKTRSRFNEFKKLVDEDLARIDGQIEVAMALSQEMPEEQKKKVLDYFFVLMCRMR